MMYRAGIYEQHPDGHEDTGGWARIVWSRHSRAELAEAAARRYVRRLASEEGPSTGGSESWAAWWQDEEGVHRVDSGLLALQQQRRCRWRAPRG